MKKITKFLVLFVIAIALVSVSQGCQGNKCKLEKFATIPTDSINIPAINETGNITNITNVTVPESIAPVNINDLLRNNNSTAKTYTSEDLLNTLKASTLPSEVYDSNTKNSNYFATTLKNQLAADGWEVYLIHVELQCGGRYLVAVKTTNDGFWLLDPCGTPQGTGVMKRVYDIKPGNDFNTYPIFVQCGPYFKGIIVKATLIE